VSALTKIKANLSVKDKQDKKEEIGIEGPFFFFGLQRTNF